MCIRDRYMGRGVEWIINAMPYLENCILCICGEGDLFHEMQALVKEKHLEKRVIFTGRLPFEELNQYTALADLGFILLENMGLSYYYSLPNRVFDYMKYGVPVLASNFPEIARIVEPNHTGKLISHYEPEYLAKVITQMLKEWEDKSTYKNRLKELADKYCWENEEKVMLEIVRKAKQKKGKPPLVQFKRTKPRQLSHHQSTINKIQGTLSPVSKTQIKLWYQNGYFPAAAP
eukprot:TRINITY_DN14136_c0_g1_i2.p1 TRINITY_DN14136_c0_g1~~TRINITY_DN14136_c0_g1_i2.p1  ORF type:complete len:232 (-),score=30.83 TRINITY_DN14136_c0_g1_i2:225-920(-)